MTSAAEPTTPVWPRWEVQGYGTVTCATPPGDPCALPPHQLVPPWVDIRLTFADGARVDVLAVLRDGVIAVEDAQADPPLPLDDLSGLAAWIEAPLAYASRAVAAQHRLAPDQEPRDASDPAPRDASATATDEDADRARDAEPAAYGSDLPYGGGDPYEDGLPHGGGDPDTDPDGDGPLMEREPAPSGRHRAADPASSEHAERRGVAETYRRAEQLGQDPVLAVMCATGYGRRKSLGLIASARDGGYLAPRHRRG
ncbi:DUF6214 family protein [Streptomyces sp. NBC_01498]|nr:DUF6214 family protein [Streptomyces sp. NBC_01498]WTL29026.1 DUF6214 family protein [Streptomyces sp. NBC_01498]